MAAISISGGSVFGKVRWLALIISILVFNYGCSSNELPTLMLDGPAQTTWPYGIPFIPAKAIATDNRNIDISDKIQITGDVDVFDLGSVSTIAYHVEDYEGRTARIFQFVSIEKNSGSTEGTFRTTSNCTDTPVFGHCVIKKDPHLNNHFYFSNLFGEPSGSEVGSVQCILSWDIVAFQSLRQATIPNTNKTLSVVGFFSSRFDSVYVEATVRGPQTPTEICDVFLVRE